MTSVRYIWKGSTGAKEKEDAKAQMIGERLAEIEKHHGELKAEHVLADARSDNSPLHKYFDWDDTEAAEKWRLGQARQLIKSVYVKRIEDKEVRVPTRAFVNLRPAEEADRVYENIVSVMSDEFKRTQLLKRAKEELGMWRKRYSDLNEFADVFGVIDQTLEVA